MEHPRKTRRIKLLAGGAAVIGAGTLLAMPLRTLAQEDDDTPSWVDEALTGLVEDGTLTQAQVDAVEEALRTARPEHGPGFGHHGGRGGFGLRGSLDTAAEAIGIDESALRDALRDGQTLAQVAEANGVERQAVIDALVTDVQEHLDDAVADGRLDEAEVAERLTEATERITSFVDEGLPARPDDDELPEPPTDVPAPTTTTG